MKTMAFNEALREGLHEEMARDDSIFCLLYTSDAADE